MLNIPLSTSEKKLVQVGWAAQFKEKELPLAPKHLQTVTAGFLKKLGLAGGALEVWLDSDAGIAQLNQTGRGYAKPTDVLSWRYWDVSPKQCAEEGCLLGEVAISLETAHRQAIRYGWDWQEELLRILAHGCTHVGGYDHQEPSEAELMQAQENSLLQAIGLKLIINPLSHCS